MGANSSYNRYIPCFNYNSKMVPISATTPLPVDITDANINVTASEVTTGQLVRAGQVGSDTSFVFAGATTPVNSQVSATFVKPATPVYEHQIVVYNPSTESDLSVKMFAVCTPFSGAGGSADAYIDTLTIPKSQTVTGTSISAHSNSVFGLFNGVSAKFVVSNNTVLATPVTPVMRIREVF